MAVSYSGLVVGTTLAASDKVAFLDISDLSQSVNGSVLAITVTNFFKSPVTVYAYGAADASAYLPVGLVSNVSMHVVRAAAAPTIFTLRVNGTLAAPTAILTTQTIGKIQAYGWGATVIKDGPYILTTSTENWSDTVSGSKMDFYTVPNTTTNPVVALTLGQDQSATVTCATASAFAVGRLGAITPAFVVDSSTGSQVAGLKVTGAATGGTVAIVAIDSGADTNVTLNAKGIGTIGIGSVSTGRVTITPVTTITGSLTLSAALVYGGVTLSNAVTGTGNMVLSASPTLTGTAIVATVTASGTVKTTGTGGLVVDTAGAADFTADRGANTDTNGLFLQTNATSDWRIGSLGTLGATSNLQVFSFGGPGVVLTFDRTTGLGTSAYGLAISANGLDITGNPATAAASHVNIGGAVQTTIGANGAASALTANPLGYIKINVAGTSAIIPYYNA